MYMIIMNTGLNGYHMQNSPINNSISTSTGHTPFYLNYGEHPATPLSNVIPNIDDVPEAADTIKKIQEALCNSVITLLLYYI